MPVNWIRTPGYRHYPNLQHSFCYLNDPYSGFMFDVDDETRQVLLRNDEARAHYQKCLEAVAAGSMIDQGIEDFGGEHLDAGAIRCGCGRAVELRRDWRGTRCECGREYDDAGQELRANWRELCRETGELTDEDFLT